MTPRLVLVEGFPGSGKSTTAQWLAGALARAGRRARWVYEEEQPHPVSRGYAAAETASIADFASAYWARWDGVARAAADADEDVVLDGAFVQWPAFVLLQRDVAADVVVEFIVGLGERLAARGAATIYTPTADADRALRSLGDRRGNSWLLHHAIALESTRFARARDMRGMATLFAYWCAHASACDRIIATLTMPKLVLDPASPWAERRRATADFIGIEPDGAGTVRLEDVDRYIGAYRARGGRHAARILVDDGRLVMDGVLWPRNGLLPKSRDVFEVEGWPYDVTFFDDGARFSVTGPVLAWGRPPAEFERVD